MADMVVERVDRKMYKLVYSRRTAGRFKPHEIAKGDDLKEMMRKVVSGRSKSITYRAIDSLSEHCIDNVRGKESAEMITMKEEPKPECSMQDRQIGEGVSIGNGLIEVDIVQKEESKKINTPMKRNRGADGEIVSAYLLSPKRSLSRLRPRKEVPAFRMVNLEEKDNEFVVGKRVKVYWSGSRRWFTGRIVDFDNKNMLHRILYEDGDKEVLDLRKERFQLEVMPIDHFKLQSEPYFTRKADGPDTGNVREAVMKENARNVSGAKTMTKSSESNLKKEAKKEGKRSSLEEKSKDAEVIMVDLVSNVDVIPNNADEVVTNMAGDMEEPGEASSEEDESNLFPKATLEIEAEATIVKSHSVLWSMGSDNSTIKESGNAVEEDSLKISIAELAKKAKGSRKRLMSRAKRMRTSRAFIKDFGNVVEKPEADMKSHILSDEAKTLQSDVDVNCEAVNVSYQNISRRNEVLEKKASEGDETSNEASFTSLDLMSRKKAEIGSGDVSRNAANKVDNLTDTENRIAEDVITSLPLSPWNFIDERQVLADEMEFTIAIKETEDELMAGFTNVQRPRDVYSMNINLEAESILEAENMKPCEASCQLQPMVQISPEKAKPTVLQGKVKLENGESGKESKEGMDFISERSAIYGSNEDQNNGAAS
ncbi:hypothetical protein PTKIN_Ptkin11bG0095700 [Pterospermum kingtungense]